MIETSASPLALFMRAARAITKSRFSLIYRGEKDLKKCSDLGHYLKGSSATIGLSKVKLDCEKIQNFGNKLDATGAKPEPNEKVCLNGIADALAHLNEDYKEAAGVLKRFFDVED